MADLSQYRKSYTVLVYKLFLVIAIYIAWFISCGYPNGGSCSISVNFKEKE